MRKRIVCFILLFVLLCSFGLSTFALDVDDFFHTVESNYSILIYYPTIDRFDTLQFQGNETGRFEFNEKFISSPVYFMGGASVYVLEYLEGGNMTFTQYKSDGTIDAPLIFPSDYLIRMAVSNNLFNFWFYAPGAEDYSFRKYFNNGTDYQSTVASVFTNYYYNQILSDGHAEGYSEGFTDGQNSFILPDDKANGYFYAPIRTALSYVVGDDLADIMTIPILVFFMLTIFIFIFTLCRYRDKFYVLRATCIAVIVLVTIYCIGTFGLPWISIGGVS